MKRILLGLMILATGGCYHAVPLPAGNAPPGTRVIVHLSDQGSIELAAVIGPGIVTLGGDLLTADDREIAIAARAATDRRGIETYWGGERVVVPRAHVTRLEERRLSRNRSFLVAGGILLGLILLTDALTGVAGIFGSGGNPDGS